MYNLFPSVQLDNSKTLSAIFSTFILLFAVLVVSPSFSDFIVTLNGWFLMFSIALFNSSFNFKKFKSVLLTSKPNFFKYTDIYLVPITI